jgi:hypothetical protein
LFLLSSYYLHLTGLGENKIYFLTMVGEDEKAERIGKFDGTDFAYWKMHIEDVLYGKDLHLPLLGSNQTICLIAIGPYLIERPWQLSGYRCQDR